MSDGNIGNRMSFGWGIEVWLIGVDGVVSFVGNGLIDVGWCNYVIDF